MIEKNTKQNNKKTTFFMGKWFGEDDTSVQMNRLPLGYPLSLGGTVTLLQSEE